MQTTKIKTDIDTVNERINRTYSLENKYIELLNKIYIKRLQKGISVEKSMIISEGIELVYNKEFKK